MNVDVVSYVHLCYLLVKAFCCELCSGEIENDFILVYYIYCINVSKPAPSCFLGLLSLSLSFSKVQSHNLECLSFYVKNPLWQSGGGVHPWILTN